MIDEAPEGVPPNDLPPQPPVFAPDYAPEEISEIGKNLRQAADLPKRPTASSPTSRRPAGGGRQRPPAAGPTM